jgi:predicted PurR-regulated permease PerM
MNIKIFFLVSFCAVSLTMLAQNVSSNKDIENINKEINALKVSNEKLKMQLTANTVLLDQKTEAVKKILESSEQKISHNKDSLVSVTLYLADFQKYTLHKIARHKKVLQAGLLWMFIGFVVLTLFTLGLFLMLRKRLNTEFKILIEKMSQSQNMFNKQLNISNEALDNKINVNKNILAEEIVNLRKLLEKEIVQAEQIFENKLKFLDDKSEERLLQQNQIVEQNMVNLRKDIETKMNEMQKTFDLKIHELITRLNKVPGLEK